jgi:hypothetical protein
VILASRLRILGLLAAAGTAAMAACTTTTTTTTFTPITGIEIRSAALVAGFGCGLGAGQVFRYAAALSFAGGSDAGALVQQNGVPLTNIFDCFADGVFENLPSSDAGSLTFNVAIFAYNEDAYFTAGLPANLGCAPTPDGGAQNCDPGTRPLTAAQEGFATWTTVCTATQQAGTPVIAVCGPLQSTAPTTGPDAATDAASDGMASGPADAAADATQDAAAATDGAPDGALASPDAGDSSTDASAADGSSDG